MSEKRKIESVSEDGPQIGTKLVLISTFSHWMMEWNKIRNWGNKKVLLNVVFLHIGRYSIRRRFALTLSVHSQLLSPSFMSALSLLKTYKYSRELSFCSPITSPTTSFFITYSAEKRESVCG